jgi:hypothetical protein
MTVMDFYGRRDGPLEVLPRYMSGGNKETIKIISPDSQCPGRETNRALLII